PHPRHRRQPRPPPPQHAPPRPHALPAPRRAAPHRPPQRRRPRTPGKHPPGQGHPLRHRRPPRRRSRRSVGPRRLRRGTGRRDQGPPQTQLRPAAMIPTLSSLPASLDARLDDDTRAALADAPREQRQPLLAAALGLADDTVCIELARAAGLPHELNPAADLDSLRLLPPRLASDFQVIPLASPAALATPVDNDTPPADTLPAGELRLATSWPPTPEMADWIATFTPRPLVWHLAPAERVHQLIVENYGVGSGSLDDSDDDDLLPSAGNPDSNLDADQDAAVVRFVTDVIAQAVTDEATDIHFEPQEGQLRIRYRVDGLLVPVPVPENLLRFQDAIISRLKIMARLNISEKRLPQDGRINFRAGSTNLDIRVSTI